MPSVRSEGVGEDRVLVTPPRIELGTYSLEGCCSIHLSYGANVFWFSQLSPARQRRFRFPESRLRAESKEREILKMAAARTTRLLAIFEKSRCSGSSICHLLTRHASRGSVRRTNRELLLPAQPNDDKAQNGRSGACPPNARLTTVRRGYPLVRQIAQRMKATGQINS